MYFLLIKILFCVVSVLLLVSVFIVCGGLGSSGNSDYIYVYLYFYNGLLNGVIVYFCELDGDDFGVVQFGDSSLLFVLDLGELELEFYCFDLDDQEVVIDEFIVQLKKLYKMVVIMCGDFEFFMFELYQFKCEMLDEYFCLMVMLVLIDEIQFFDIYMSDVGDLFEVVNYLGIIEVGELIEYIYWDGDLDSEDFNEDEYIIYLINFGEIDVVFEMFMINFVYNIEYVLLMCDILGVI